MIKSYAKISSGIVENIILATEEGLSELEGKFIECDIDESIRYNYPQVGGRYDEENDAFIGIQPFEDWVLNSETFKWEAPIAKPEGKHFWYEGSWSPIAE